MSFVGRLLVLMQHHSNRVQVLQLRISAVATATADPSGSHDLLRDRDDLEQQLLQSKTFVFLVANAIELRNRSDQLQAQMAANATQLDKSLQAVVHSMDNVVLYDKRIVPTSNLTDALFRDVVKPNTAVLPWWGLRVTEFESAIENRSEKSVKFALS
jgi:hypothetical protein